MINSLLGQFAFSDHLAKALISRNSRLADFYPQSHMPFLDKMTRTIWLEKFLRFESAIHNLLLDNAQELKAIADSYTELCAYVAYLIQGVEVKMHFVQATPDYKDGLLFADITKNLVTQLIEFQQVLDFVDSVVNPIKNFLHPYLEMSKPECAAEDMFSAWISNTTKKTLDHGIRDLEMLHHYTDYLSVLKDALQSQRQSKSHASTDQAEILKVVGNKVEPSILEKFKKYLASQSDSVNAAINVVDENLLRVEQSIVHRRRQGTATARQQMWSAPPSSKSGAEKIPGFKPGFLLGKRF